MASFQYDLYGELYTGTAMKVGKYGFPQLAEENYIPTKQVKPFNYLLSTKKLNDLWIHCFCDDYQFERLWTGLDFYLHYILKLQGFISTDFSLYRDYSDDALIWNCYRNRCMAYAIQKAGGIMIPTAGFGPERTWEWCFDGLPMNSSVAIFVSMVRRKKSTVKRIYLITFVSFEGTSQRQKKGESYGKF